MCEFLDSALVELAIDVAIEHQRLQIESELAHARVGRAATSVPPIRLKLLFILGVLACVAARADPIVFESPERQAALVELFTSEGCSSCPPAESWLSQLKQKPGLWSDFVPVAFHVDYWDYIGWRDKWATKEFSDRQRNYAQAWGSRSVYTPGFVVNGKEWPNWFGLKTVPAGPRTKAGVLRIVSEDANRWSVSFVPASSGASDYEVHAAVLVSGVSSEVRRGENAGRNLQHDFAALTLTTQALARQNARFQAVFLIDTQQNRNEGRLALAFWATRSGHLEPIQAAGGWLPAPEKN